MAYLEEEPNNEDLEPSHAHHHQALDNTEVEDSPLRAAHRAKVPVLSRAEIFLIARDSRELARQLENRFLQRGGLFW